MKARRLKYLVVVSFLLDSTIACRGASGLLSNPQDTPLAEVSVVDREAAIPNEAVKMSAENDDHPPQIISADFAEPVPVPGSVNTAGAEDSPFIDPDGDTLYFFFTPDTDIPVEKQVTDGVTGIYMSKMSGEEWGKPEFLRLQDPGNLALNGCAYVQTDLMWFCSAREGYTGLHWFTSEYVSGRWINWQIADFAAEYEVGELHISDDGSELYFHSSRSGGMGELDIWVSENSGGEWQLPVNITAVNTVGSEGWPALSPDGKELWFSRNYGIWRSKSVDNEWQVPE